SAKPDRKPKKPLFRERAPGPTLATSAPREPRSLRLARWSWRAQSLRRESRRAPIDDRVLRAHAREEGRRWSCPKRGRVASSHDRRNREISAGGPDPTADTPTESRGRLPGCP